MKTLKQYEQEINELCTKAKKLAKKIAKESTVEEKQKILDILDKVEDNNNKFKKENLK